MSSDVLVKIRILYFFCVDFLSASQCAFDEPPRMVSESSDAVVKAVQLIVFPLKCWPIQTNRLHPLLAHTHAHTPTASNRRDGWKKASLQLIVARCCRYEANAPEAPFHRQPGCDWYNAFAVSFALILLWRRPPHLCVCLRFTHFCHGFGKCKIIGLSVCL